MVVVSVTALIGGMRRVQAGSDFTMSDLTHLYVWRV